MIRLDRVGKTYPDGSVAVGELSLDIPRDEICILVGPLGLRQDDDAADDQPARRADVGPDLPRRERRDRRRSRGAPPAHGLRDPADRALPASDDRHEHRNGPAPSRVEEGSHQRTRRRAARARGPPPRRLPHAVPGADVRRPAPARRRGAGARRRSRRPPHGRAVRRHRPRDPHAPARRISPAPRGGGQDGGVRHPRHRGSDQDGRPDRPPQRRRRPRAVRHSRAHPRAPRLRHGRRLRRAPTAR